MLIIVDNAAMRRALRTLLEARFTDVSIGEFDSAQAALELCGAHSPRVVVLDLGSSGANRLHVLPALRAALPAALIIVFLQPASGVYAERALAAGADGCLGNEGLYEELIPMIERGLGCRRSLTPDRGEAA